METPRQHRPHDGIFVLDARGQRSHSVDVAGGQLIVGRAPDSDLVLNSPDVSRHHAALTRTDVGVFVRDLGSTAGTRVNGIPITAPRLLRGGDVVACASASFEFEHLGGGRLETPRTITDQHEPVTSTRFDVSTQHAGTISNVAGNQHNAFPTQILHERESLLRDIAGTRSKARWIIMVGFALFVVGFAAFAAGILQFFTSLGDSFGTGGQPEVLTPFGTDLFGIPSGLVGWSAAALGAILMVVGMVLHIVASARRKNVDRDLPLPWPEPPARRTT
ncbi:FHA domain-containing protein [Arthrobacter sp. JSM 101049]|uniref:FHA domain-containing protein n=1 Tax=Arthrobacter sp. JSM 101049 TaxID=929097 RepID=UPI00356A2408